MQCRSVESARQEDLYWERGAVQKQFSIVLLAYHWHSGTLPALSMRGHMHLRFCKLKHHAVFQWWRRLQNGIKINSHSGRISAMTSSTTTYFVSRLCGCCLWWSLWKLHDFPTESGEVFAVQWRSLLGHCWSTCFLPMIGAYKIIHLFAFGCHANIACF